MSGADLRGRRVVITGASRGLGRALVEMLVTRGARVAGIARPSDQLRALGEMHGDAVIPLACDLSAPADIDTIISTAATALGGIDLLINNAAVFHPFLLEEARAEQIEQHFRVNVMSPAWLIRAAIPHLRRAKGQIISISSESVRMPFPYLTVYAATKAALETLSAGLREELREDGIRVSVLRAGSMVGGDGARHWDPAVAERFFDTINRSGHAQFTGVPASQDSVAAVLLNLITSPHDVNIDLIEARGAAASQAFPRPS